jgi:hypothetical protein
MTTLPGCDCEACRVAAARAEADELRGRLEAAKEALAPFGSIGKMYLSSWHVTYTISAAQFIKAYDVWAAASSQALPAENAD